MFQLRPKGDIKAVSERTDTDKKHARRVLKHKMKLKSQDKPKKANAEEEAKGKDLQLTNSFFFYYYFLLSFRRKTKSLEKTR